MSIDKLAEFAKDGDKNLDNLDVSKGFLQSEKPERQWFNKLFNDITTKTNEVIDYTDGLIEQVQAPKLDSNITTTQTVPSMLARSQADKNFEHLTVKDFGALGDFSGATVQHWYTLGSAHYRGYSDLAAVQVDFPHVLSAEDTIDLVACQAALNTGANNVYAPSGLYVFNRPLKTKHTGSYYRNDTGQVFYGDGVKTVFLRNNTNIATRVPSTATNEEKLIADQANANEAVIAVHGSNNEFHSFRIAEGAVGLYLGQDYTVLENSSVCHNTFRNITIRNCGTGYISAASDGNHYNEFSGIHFVQCQIDAHLKNGGRWTGSNNNNRNTFFKIRSARSRIGIWIESGDSNVLYSWHGEGCGTTAQGNSYPAVIGMPDDIQSGVHVIGGQLNRVHNAQMEDCQIELYNYGYNNEFYANGYHEFVSNGTQVINKTPPAKFISQNTLYSKGYVFIANYNALAFPDVARAGVPTLSGSAVYNNVPEIEHKNTSHTGARHTAKILEYGSITQATSKTQVLWSNSGLQETASIRLQVVGASNSSNMGFAVNATVVALRSSSSTLTRYHLVVDKAIRATGTAAGDELEPVTLSLTVTGKDLLLNITAPSARDLEAVSVYVDRLVCKAP